MTAKLPFPAHRIDIGPAIHTSPSTGCAICPITQESSMDYSQDTNWIQRLEQIKQGGAVVYGQRETIATEFIHIYRHDEAKFKADYPEHTAGITALLDAIRKAKGRRGELKLRRSKNRSPEECAQRYAGL
ncbi:hypothetical protein OE88DRAFT_1646805 [Heliocybe sulcata]|uniref:Uncharacterized protein n=1 Tax=Heliocybe sulcata TaxID=5364 RepID=A0A5C3MY33_9AGAM|nr:hypothetical protein OE88DRAFT_1646805 [Heliocybe sulcata]